MIAASAFMRPASAGVFAAAASLSRLAPIDLSSATAFLSVPEASTLAIAALIVGFDEW
jgi:hypothetical protein